MKDFKTQGIDTPGVIDRVSGKKYHQVYEILKVKVS